MIFLDCNEGVCPLVDAVVTCQVTDRGSMTAVRWCAPSDTLIGTVTQASSITELYGYTAMYIGNGTSTLVFSATADRNSTDIKCLDVADSESNTCMVLVTG